MKKLEDLTLFETKYIESVLFLDEYTADFLYDILSDTGKEKVKAILTLEDETILGEFTTLYCSYLEVITDIRMYHHYLNEAFNEYGKSKFSTKAIDKLYRIEEVTSALEDFIDEFENIRAELELFVIAWGLKYENEEILSVITGKI